MYQHRCRDGCTLTTTDTFSDEKLHHSFFHIHEWDPRFYNPSGMWEVANTSAACEPEGVLSLLTPDAVWACSVCVQWDDRGDNMKVHLMEK